MRLIKRLIGGLVILAALLVALAYAALQFINIEKIKQIAIEKVNEQTGRTLVINGTVSPSLGLKPSIIIENVSLSNPSWAKSDQLITADSITLSANLLPLLERRIEISNVTVKKAAISLESSKKGTKSWVFKKNNTAADASKDIADSEKVIETSEGAQVDLSVDHINLNDSTLTYIDHASGAKQTLVIDSLSINGFDGTSVESAMLEGKYNGAPLSANAELSNQLLQLNANLSNDDVSVKAKGSMAIADQSFDMDVKANADHLNKLLMLFGQKGTDSTSLSVDGTLSGTADVISFSKLQAVYGDTHIDGSGSVNLSKKTPYVQAKLSIPNYTVPAKEKASAPAKTTTESATATEQAPNNETPLFPIDALGALNADINISIGSVKLESMTLSDVTTTAKLNQKLLTLSPLSLKTKHGSLSGSVSLAANTPTPTLAIDLTSTNMRLASLVKEFAQSTAATQGDISSHINITAQGNNVEQLKNSASGTANFYIDKAKYDLPDSAKNAAQFFDLLTSEEGSDIIDVNCFVSNFNLTNGVAKPEILALKTPSAIVTGTGSIDIGKGRMDMAFKARGSNVINLSDITPPVRVQGPFNNLSFLPDPTGSIVGIGKLLLGSASGIGLVAILGEKVTDTMGITADNNPCLKAMSEELAKKEESKPETPKETYKLLEDNVREKRDVIKGDAKKNIKTIEKDIKSIRDGFLGVLGKE